MALTVSAMDTRLKSLLGDANSTKYTQATHRLPALNMAQTEIVLKLLAYHQKYRGVFDILREIQTSQATSAITSATSGYALSGLTRAMVANGFMQLQATINSTIRYITKLSPDRAGLTKNQYLYGTDENPVAYILANSLYVQCDTYDVTPTIWYVREPGEMVASGAAGTQVTTCELNPLMHELVVQLAAAIAREMGEEYQQAGLIRNNVDLQIQMLATGQMNEPAQVELAGQQKRK